MTIVIFWLSGTRARRTTATELEVSHHRERAEFGDRQRGELTLGLAARELRRSPISASAMQ